MLPYIPRAVGAVKKLIKRKDEVSQDLEARGGPLRGAMQKDLGLLYTDFARRIEQQEPLPTDQHDKPGNAFTIFRQVFGENKIALVHTRTIPPRSDLESYSQSLYAAALAMIPRQQRQDKPNERNLFLQATLALFSVYMLYETNPHSSTTEKPLQLLPMAIQGDNPKLLYRRSFSKKVRVDRRTYLKLLEWNEVALARQAECSNNQLKADGWTCQCGLATDYCRVWERMKYSWQYSEHTGPRTAECIAEQQDEQYDDIDDENEELDKEETDQCKLGIANVTAAPAGMLSSRSTILEYLDTYRNRLKEIKLPNKETNQAKRVQSKIKPLFATSWDAVRLLSSTVEKWATVPMQQRVIVLGERGRTEDGAMTASQQSKNEPTQPIYKLILPDSLPQAVEKGLQRALDGLLFKGEDLLPPEEDHPPAMIAAPREGDEVSSIGHFGGASILMTEKEASVEAQNSRVVPFVVQNEGGGRKDFLLLDGAMETVDDMVGVDSDLSSMSGDGLGDDDDDDDDDYGAVSAATSAVGQQALRNLLEAVDHPAQTDETKRRRNLKRRAGRNVDDVSSTATSAVGRQALQELLTNVDQEEPRQVSNTNPSIKSAAEEEEISEDTSIATSAVGGRALRNLLAAAEESKGGRKPKSNPRKRRKTVSQPAPTTQDDMSAATSNVGRASLHKLLSTAASTETGGKDYSDATSVAASEATSAPGGQALHKLLSSVASPRSQEDQSNANVQLQSKAKVKVKENVEASDEMVSMASSAEEAMVDDNSSIAHSTATSSVGGRALADLLLASDATGGSGKKTKSPKHNTVAEDASVADSTATPAVGKNALATLLTAAAKARTKKSRLVSKMKSQPSRRSSEQDNSKNDDVDSVADSAVGGRALRSLLSRAKK